jgi:glutamine cyclotransferase
MRRSAKNICNSHPKNCILPKIFAMRFLLMMTCLCGALFTACSSCNGSGTKPGQTAAQQRPRQQKAQIAIVSPKNNEQQPLGATITLSTQMKDGAETIDSLRWFVDGKWLKTTKGEDITWNTAGQTTGTHRVEAVSYYSSGQRENILVSILLLAPQAPKQYTYKVIQTYPHDTKAYTQGLLFDEGFLYESTGLRGESTLRKVNLQTGESVMSINLATEMFGEGLALVGDKLIQLTWQNQVAFVYQKSDFKQLNRINYQIREGWGLTYNGTHLLMTDGSATLYFLDKDYLTEVRRLEVCDDKGAVYQLNELEYINGELWANVYTTDDILRIDPKTGVVTGRINMAGLLNSSEQKAADVLNGIAYDEKTGKIYVTGKYWPKLFEIQVNSR